MEVRSWQKKHLSTNAIHIPGFLLFTEQIRNYFLGRRVSKAFAEIMKAS